MLKCLKGTVLGLVISMENHNYVCWIWSQFLTQNPSFGGFFPPNLWKPHPSIFLLPSHLHHHSFAPFISKSVLVSLFWFPIPTVQTYKVLLVLFLWALFLVFKAFKESPAHQTTSYSFSFLSPSHYNNERFRKCLTSSISHQVQRCKQITVSPTVSFACSTNMLFYTRLWKSFSWLIQQ